MDQFMQQSHGLLSMYLMPENRLSMSQRTRRALCIVLILLLVSDSDMSSTNHAIHCE